MKTQAYFENIQQHIKTELLNADISIKIAIAWFTDAELFKNLCQRANDGIEVELILINDQINNNSGINFNLLNNANGKLWLIESTKETPLIRK
jgi:phosphatidylserine/phosphatidylglycerophosphate/cardiolipin synthase-like enzyme